MLKNELYFYTATICQWRPLLQRHELQQVILDSLAYLHEKGCIKVYGFVIMPNHLHLIWELLANNGKESPAASLMKFTAHQFEDYLRKKAPAELKTFAVDLDDRRYNFWQPKPDWFPLHKLGTIQ